MTSVLCTLSAENSRAALTSEEPKKACPCAKRVHLPSRQSKSLQSCRSQGLSSWLTAFTSCLLSNTRSAKSFSSQLFQSDSGGFCLVGAFHWRSRAVSAQQSCPLRPIAPDGAPGGHSTHTWRASSADAGGPVGCIVFGRAASLPPFFVVRKEIPSP